MKTRQLCACLIAGQLLFASFGPAALADEEQTQRALTIASTAMRQGDYAEAYCLLRPLAERGHADAQFNIGWMYHNGYGLNIDDVKAVNWWQQAAAQDHLGAHLSLGLLFKHGGYGIDANLPVAINHLKIAAAANEEEAQLVLRVLLAQEPDTVLEILPDLMTTQASLLGAPSFIQVDRANVRAGPGTNHRIVAAMQQNEPLLELLTKNAWVKVLIMESGRVAWLHNSLIRPATDAEKSRWRDAGAANNSIGEIVDE